MVVKKINKISLRHKSLIKNYLMWENKAVPQILFRKISPLPENFFWKNHSVFMKTLAFSKRGGDSESEGGGIKDFLVTLFSLTAGFILIKSASSI